MDRLFGVKAPEIALQGTKSDMAKRMRKMGSMICLGVV